MNVRVGIINMILFFLYIILEITKLMGGVPFDNVTVSSFYDRVKYHESIDTKSQNYNLVLRFSLSIESIKFILR